MKITCGEDCGECYYHETLEAWYTVDTITAGCPDGIIAAKNGECAPRFGYCYRCGCKLSFAADGTPQVGASYAELEGDKQRLDRLHQHFHLRPMASIVTLDDLTLEADDHSTGYLYRGDDIRDLADALQEPDPRPVAGRGVYAAGLEAMLGEDALPGAGNEGAEGGE